MMGNKKSSFLIYLLCCAPLSSCGLAEIRAVDTSYMVNIGKDNKEYYHLQYEITPPNLIHVEELTKTEFFENGGQFEVVVQKTTFPVESPKCHSNIIIRMPWVPNSDALDKKYNLYEEINRVFESKEGAVFVSIELNPYIEKTSDVVSLANCNVFFRHTKNEYVPHSGSLR